MWELYIWICVVGEGVEKSVEVLGGRCGVGEDKVSSGMEKRRERERKETP